MEDAMENTFITNIFINKVRHLKDVEIELSETERKHLILTGKNGSGKTSVLEAIREVIMQGQTLAYRYGKRSFNRFKLNSTINLTFLNEIQYVNDFTFAYLSARRSKLELPQTIEAVNLKGKTLISKNLNQGFLKYFLNLYVQYLSAKDSNQSPSEIRQYTGWLHRFTQALRDIYDCQELYLKPDMRKLVFNIIMPGREPFGLHEMSDGYQAFIEILMELLMRFESYEGVVAYNHPAIVLIDEIETHLHVELQKKALPFLTTMFPNVQFIVTTHSPFVITSLRDAVVYDLEKHEQLENPSYYSYEAVVESFLDSDMYSYEVKRQLNRYKELAFKERTPEENEEFLRIKAELEMMSPASKELYIAFRTLELKRKEAKNREAKNG